MLILILCHLHSYRREKLSSLNTVGCCKKDTIRIRNGVIYRVLLVLVYVFWYIGICCGLYYSVSNPPNLLRVFKFCKSYKQSH